METNNTQEIKKLPWGIKILLFLGGQFAASSILAFFALIIKDAEALCAILGIGLLVANVFVSRQKDERFIYAFCLPMYIDGISLFLNGLHIENVAINALLPIIIAVVTYFFIENRFFKNLLVLQVFSLLPVLIWDMTRTHSVWHEIKYGQESLCILGFVYIMIYLATCFLEEPIKKIKVLDEALSAIRFSTVIGGFVMVFFNDNTIINQRKYSWETVNEGIYNFDWLSAIYAICAIIVAWYLIYKYYGDFAFVPMIMSAAIIVLASFYRPIVMSLLCIMLGFWTKDRRIWIMSIVFSVGCIIFYYYNVTISLLEKSLGLMAIGTALLLVSLYIFKQDKQIDNKKEMSHE